MTKEKTCAFGQDELWELLKKDDTYVGIYELNGIETGTSDSVYVSESLIVCMEHSLI
jgi:hypothetical protein